EVISLHKRLVRIPSLSGEERVVADFVEAHVLERGIETRRLDDNVYFWIGDGDHTLLLTTHLDVVPPSADHPFDRSTRSSKTGASTAGEASMRRHRRLR